MNIPFVELKAQYESIKGEIAAAIQEIIENKALTDGPFAKRFEESFYIQ